MIDTLLLALIAVLLAVSVWQKQRHHHELIAWLDALGDMTGDMLRGILDSVRKE